MDGKELLDCILDMWKFDGEFEYLDTNKRSYDHLRIYMASTTYLPPIIRGFRYALDRRRMVILMEDGRNLRVVGGL